VCNVCVCVVNCCVWCVCDSLHVVCCEMCIVGQMSCVVCRMLRIERGVLCVLRVG